MCTVQWTQRGKKENASRSWKKADIWRLRRLQHLEAILLLCCGQVRCTELNSTTTMAKRAAETKEGYPCFLTPSLLEDQSPRAPQENNTGPPQEKPGEWQTASFNTHTFCITAQNAHMSSVIDTVNRWCTQTPKRIYQCADEAGCLSWAGGRRPWLHLSLV